MNNDNPFATNKVVKINDHFRAKLVGLDIEKEYALIQQKKCLQPVMVRNLICVEYNNIQLRKAIDIDIAQEMAAMNAGEIAAMNGGEIDD